MTSLSFHSPLYIIHHSKSVYHKMSGRFIYMPCFYCHNECIHDLSFLLARHRMLIQVRPITLSIGLSLSCHTEEYLSTVLSELNQQL